jgi:hypothetical protein
MLPGLTMVIAAPVPAHTRYWAFCLGGFTGGAEPSAGVATATATRTTEPAPMSTKGVANFMMLLWGRDVRGRGASDALGVN